MKKIIVGIFLVVGVFSTPVLSTKIHLLYDDIVDGFNPETDEQISIPKEEDKSSDENGSDDTEHSSDHSDEQSSEHSEHED